MAFAGAVIGAGFASGQEIYQFFARHGPYGGAGLVLAAALFFLVGQRALQAGRSGYDTVGTLLAATYPVPLRPALEAVLALLPALSLALAASVGSETLRLWFHLPWWLGGVLTLGPALLLAAFGIKTVTLVNAVVLPFLLATTVAVALHGRPAPAASSAVHVWIGAAAVYASYNLFLSLGVTLGAGPLLSRPQDSWKAAGLATVLTFGTATLVYRALLGSPETGIPLWPAAVSMGSPWPHLYALSLFAALFGSAVAQAYILVSRYGPRLSFLALLLVLAVPLGLPALVRHGYPIFGGLAVFFWAPLLIGLRRRYPA